MTKERQLDPTILREYDIRGIVGDTLNPEDLRAIGHGFGTIIARGGGTCVAIGYDGRLSSPELAAAAVEGLSAAGLRVMKVGRGPSPMLYYATHVLEADAGMMITGSHNPPDYNGIKMSLGAGSFFGDDIQVIGDPEEYFIVPRHLLLQYFQVFPETVVVLGRKADGLLDFFPMKLSID